MCLPCCPYFRAEQIVPSIVATRENCSTVIENPSSRSKETQWVDELSQSKFLWHWVNSFGDIHDIRMVAMPALSLYRKLFHEHIVLYGAPVSLSMEVALFLRQASSWTVVYQQLLHRAERDRGRYCQFSSRPACVYSTGAACRTHRNSVVL